jgi:hypothetical protein
MAVAAEAAPRNIWLHSARYDLTFLIGSAVLAAVPLSLFYVFGVSTTWINYLVAALVGGPHLYSTYGLNYMDGSFRRKHVGLLLSTLIIPPIVLWLALNNLTLLLTIFFFSASIHVLHQIAYISDSYRHKDPRPRPLWNRAIDYGLIFSGLYPLATHKLVADQFFVAGRVIPIPQIAKQPWVPYLVLAVFLFFLVAFVMKTVWEWRNHRFNLASTVLISVTTCVSLIIPTFSNLDVAFQGYNTWHSFQYLALVWLILNLRRKRGELDNKVLEKVTNAQKPFRFYGLFFGFTGAAVGLILILQYGLGFGSQQAYYTVVLGSLLIHYYLDAFNFTRFGQLTAEPPPGEWAAEPQKAVA